MSIDPKIAKHICNVVRRQVQGSYPELYIHYVVHAEDKREDAFHADRNIIMSHPAGYVAYRYPNKDDTKKILSKNRSRFVSIARHNSPGFLGFFKNNAYLAFCFLNYDRFSSEENLRNHAIHMAWHAITLYTDYKDTLQGNTPKDQPATFIDVNQLIVPSFSHKQLFHKNLLGDIFSASLQSLQGREESFALLARQRILDGLCPTVGFKSENFPFPVCLDTLEFVFQNHTNHYKATKKTLLSAVKMTEEIGKTYETSTTEQWMSFSLPAQKMAWSGHRPETILGAALYTAEDAYVQSIADLIADKMEMRPDPVTMLPEYNPFANPETNERMHKKQCYDLIDSLCKKTYSSGQKSLFLDAARNQIHTLLENRVMGWCVPALIRASEVVGMHDDNMPMTETLKTVVYEFERDVDATPWSTLTYLFDLIFFARREGEKMDIQKLLNITSQNDEFTSIHIALTSLHSNAPPLPDSSTSQTISHNSMSTTPIVEEPKVHIADLLKS